MAKEGTVVDGGREIRRAGALLVRRPFLTIVLVEVLLGVAESNIGELIGSEPTADLEFWGGTATIFFAVTSVYLQIATILAAGGSGDGSAEGWIRAALRHRCFWRFLATSLVMAFLILLGALALIVGAVVVASAIALAQPAVVLERLGPAAALRRSIELTRPARRAVGIVFIAFLLPALLVNIPILVAEIDLALPARIALATGNTLLAVAATIAWTRIFVALGGAPAPPLQTLLYKGSPGTGA